VAASPPDLVLLDIWLPDLDGIEVLRQLKESKPELPVVMMSGHGTIEMAVRSTKLGAYDFIEKPLGMEKTILTVRHALDQNRLSRENDGLRRIIEDKYRIVGTSRAVRDLVRQIDIAAPTNGRVLIYGENGTGKELVARTIHLKSRRFNKAFVEINCAAIPEELIESELFGHEKGSFTGAFFRKQGKFELADGGTLFLDEVADMSLKTQAKVLRALEEQDFTRVGGTKTIHSDVRVIAASNKNLEEEIHAGRFREDLFYRLNVIPFVIPPLRDRSEDIPALVDHFFAVFAGEHGRDPKTLTPEAREKLLAYRWPGNIRELKNLVERTLIMSAGDPITAADIPLPGPGDTAASRVEDEALLSLKEARQEFEKRYITEVLARNDGNISRTARVLGMERSNLHRKLKNLSIKSNDF
jgi:two-component system nitrogen regulation response regulator NtrX